MKLAPLAVIMVLFGVIAVLVGKSLSRQREISRSAELYMLDTIKDGVTQYRERGGELPGDWNVLTNAINWEKVVGICNYNKLPIP